jgi:hypothetical protein
MPSSFLSLNGPQTLVAGANVNVSTTPDPVGGTGLMESEFQVAINPTNPLNVVGFSNLPNGAGGVMRIYRSMDGGNTWTKSFIGNPNDGLGTTGRTDPTLKFDANGRLFIAYLFTGANSTTLEAARSDDGGATFIRFLSLHTLPNLNGGALPGVDKPFLTTGLDPSTGRQAVYVAYTRNTGAVFGVQQKIAIIGSNDGGNTWTQSLVIDDGDFSIFGGGGIFAGPAVGPNGELYVVWHDFSNNQIKLDRDLDGLWGNNFQFGNDVVVANLRENSINKITPANPSRGLDNGPSIDVSRTNLFSGRIYVAYMDTFNGNDTDIYLVSSDDNGAHWTSVGAAGNVEASTGTDFLPTVAVDQTSGSVNVGYYTTDGDQSGADGIANDDVNFRVASSIDGGASWSRVNLSSATSQASAMRDPNGYGDYAGLAAYGGTVRGMWSDNRGQTLDNEAFTATVSFRSATNGNTLEVVGTDAGDSIAVLGSTVNTAYVQAFVNGQQYTGLWASINQIVVSALGGNDQIGADNIAAGVPMTLSGGDGNDEIHLADLVTSGSRDLNHLASPITVDGGAGTNTIFLGDQLDPGDTTTSIDSTSVTQAGSGFGGLTYSSVNVLVFSGSNATDAINVDATLASTSVEIDLGTGSSDVSITPAATNLDNIQGEVQVFGNGGIGRLDVHDEANGVNTTYTVTSSTVSRPSAATISYFNLQAVYVDSGAAVNTINVESTGADTTINSAGGSDVINVEATSGPLTVNLAASGNPTVNVSPTAENLFTIAGKLTVNGSSTMSGSNFGTLILNDQNNPDPFSFTPGIYRYTVTSSSVTDTFTTVLSLGHITTTTATINYGGLAALQLYGGGTARTYQVNGTASGTTTTLNTANGGDAVNVEATSWDLNVKLVGSGNPTVNVSPTAQNLFTIAGTLSVNGPSTVNPSNFGTLILNDQNNPAPFVLTPGSYSYTVTSSSVTESYTTVVIVGHSITTTATINYGGLAALQLYGGGTARTYQVNSTASGTTTTLNTANGGDIVNVEATSGPLTVKLAASGNPTINVSPTAQNLGTLGNTLTVNGLGYGTLTLYDQNYQNSLFFPIAYALDGSSVNRALASPIGYSGLSAIKLNGTTSQASIYEVTDTAAMTTTTIHTGTIGDIVNVEATHGTLVVNLAAAGDPTINISPTAQDLDTLQGSLTINGSGFDNVNIDDQAHPAARNYTLTSNGLTWGGPAGITFSNLASLVLNATAFDDTVTLQSLPPNSVTLHGDGGSNTLIGPNTTNTWMLAQPSGSEGTLNTSVVFDSFGSLIGGSAPDRFVVPNGQYIAEILSGGDGAQGGGKNTLDLSAYTSPLTWNITSNYGGSVPGVVRAFALCQNVIGGQNNDRFVLSQGTGVTTMDGGPGNNTLDMSPYFLGSRAFAITGANAGYVQSIIARFQSIQNIIGSQADDRFAFAPGAYLDGTMDGQGGNNTLDYSFTTGSASVNFQTGAASDVNLQGGAVPQPGGITHIQKVIGGPGSANTLIGADTPNSWNITGQNNGTVNSFAFTGFQYLTGGAAADTFFLQPGGGVSGTVDGGGGSNTLDYSHYSGDVTVDLPLGTATRIGGGIKNLQNVTGSIGNDMIVGDANANVLIGGTGRNLVIGGGGADSIRTVAANTGDNILIGGTTSYDTNLAALSAIFAEWTRTDLSFADRFSDLFDGTNGAGATPLNVVNGQLVLLNGSTVHADTSPDTLTGGGKGTSGTGTGRNWFFVDSDDTITNPMTGKSGDKVTKVR